MLRTCVLPATPTDSNSFPEPYYWGLCFNLLANRIWLSTK